MRPTLRTEILPVLLVLAAWGILLWFWPSLPDPIPTHWGIDGRPDSWMPKLPGALIGPGIATFLYLLMTVLPFIDPRSRNWEAFGGIYPVIKTGLAALLLFITYLTLSAAVSAGHVLATSPLMLGIGLLFVVLGNYLPKVRSNFFVGIRTPWTLSSDEVWYRTHRVGGRFMVVMGLATMASAWLPPSWAFAIVTGSAMGLAVVSFGYSYWLYRRLAA